MSIHGLVLKILEVFGIVASLTYMIFATLNTLMFIVAAGHPALDRTFVTRAGWSISGRDA